MEHQAQRRMTPLHFAAGAGSVKAVASILEQGVDVNTPAEHDWTPLHFAAAWGRQSVVELLLSGRRR